MGVVHRIGLGGDHVKPRDVDIGGEQAGEGCVLDRNSLTVQDKAADTAEDKHARQGGDERRNPHITDPVALPHADSQFVVYDHDDVIILESKKTRTLQAISDPAADRYYAPMLSPDERFVAFSGLRSGVLVFDIEANAIVFIGSHGTDPSFSPDGRYLIYADTRDDGHAFTQANLVLVDLHKRTYRILANPNHEIRLRASLSRNAEFVSYTTIDGDAYRAKIDK